jgi:hypothetical protein
MPAKIRVGECSPLELLSYLNSIIPSEVLKKGAQLLIPQPLVTAPLLSGLGTSVVLSDGKPDQSFLDMMDTTRGESLRGIAAGCTDRFTKRKGQKSSADRLANPMVALQSSPGGGKSTVLDFAALLSVHRQWDSFCSDADHGPHIEYQRARIYHI